MISRRQFLKATAATGVVASVGGFLSPRRTQAFYQSAGIPLFKTALRGVGPGGIPVALPGPLPAPVTGVAHYQMGIVQYQDQILPTGYGYGPTTLWGYTPAKGLGGNITPTHLGGIVVGQKGTPIQMTFHNLLFVNRHIIPVDTTIPGANQAINRTAIHLHGGLVPWISDGGPFDWFDPYGNHGLSFLNNKVLNPLSLPGAAQYYYPLKQSARFMWYHDHALGITRINAYAGLASGMLIRDAFEANLISSGLPNYIEAGGNEIPLIFQDKIFVGPDIKTADPDWSHANLQPVTQNPGSLWYAHTYEASQADGSGRWELAPGGLTLPQPSCIPEFFGDTMLVNGTVFPQATVQARRYRLRLLNACNARFLNLQLYVADPSSPNGILLDLDTTSPSYGSPKNTPYTWRNPRDTALSVYGKPAYLQIGTEGGFLSRPALIPSNVPMSIPPAGNNGSIDPSLVQKSLLISPAERPDLLIDFTGYNGQSLILYNDAPAPYPGGDDRNDYFPGWNVGDGLNGIGNPVNGTTKPGFGPNTRVLMRFNVVAATGNTDVKLSLGPSTDLTAGNDPLFVPAGVTTPPPVDNTRFLTLNEYHDAYGRLIQILGNAEAPFGSPYDGAATYLDTPPGSQGATVENVHPGDTEVWEVYNTTGDTHPMHFHLVNVQIINRQVFAGDPGTPTFVGPAIPPEPNERGWKETVPMYPGTVTRVIMKFDLSQAQIVTKQGKVIKTPESPRTGGMEYVWHCHILEHEEHDMMHAMVVK